MEQNTELLASAEFMPPPLIPTDAIEPTPSPKPSAETAAESADNARPAEPQAEASETTSRAATAAEDRPREAVKSQSAPAPESKPAAINAQQAAEDAENRASEGTAEYGDAKASEDAHAAARTETESSNASAEPDGAENGSEQKDSGEADATATVPEAEGSNASAESDGAQNGGEQKDSGESQADGEHFPTEEEIRQAIYSVVDPEINISIIDLGLVYDIIPNPEDRTVKINMTLTSPGCPLGPEITSAVYFNVTRMPGVRDCQVELVWEPMWDPNVNPNEETRIALGIW